MQLYMNACFNTVYINIARGSLIALLWEDGVLLSFPGIPLEKALGRWDYIHLPRDSLRTLLREDGIIFVFPRTPSETYLGRWEYMERPTRSLRKSFGKIALYRSSSQVFLIFFVLCIPSLDLVVLPSGPLAT